MSYFKNKLKQLVEEEIIPDIEEYLDESHEIFTTNNYCDEDLENIKNLESILVELYNILEVIKQNKATDFEYERIYEKLLSQIQDVD